MRCMEKCMLEWVLETFRLNVCVWNERLHLISVWPGVRVCTRDVYSECVYGMSVFIHLVSVWPGGLQR